MSLINTLRDSGALVLYLDFRSGNLYDYSGNNATVTLTTPTWTSRSGLFVGSGSVSVADKASLRLTAGTLVLLADFKVTGSGALIGKIFGASRNYALDVSPTNIYFRSGVLAANIAQVVTGKKSIAVNFENNTNPVFYIDGLNAGTGSVSLAVNTTTDNVYIGNNAGSSAPLANTMQAALIINRKLTASEHAQLFGELQAMKWPTKTITRAKPIKNIGLPWDNLLSAFEVVRNGNTTYDFGTVQNHGTTTGIPVFRTGRMGKEAQFGTTAATRIANTANNAYLFEHPLTISCWYRPVTTGTAVRLMGRELNNNSIYMDTDAIADFRMNADNLILSCAAGSVVRSGVWTHLAVTYDGINANIYYNGQLSATTPYSTAYIETNSACAIGGNGATASAPGSIADCKYWQRALTAPEILQEYQRGARSSITFGTAKQHTPNAAYKVFGNWIAAFNFGTGYVAPELVDGKIVLAAVAGPGSIARVYAQGNIRSSSGFYVPPGVLSTDWNFGTWEFVVNKISDSSTVRVCVVSSSTAEWDSGSISAYLVEVDANEAIGIYRITGGAKASTIMLSANGYFTRNTWHKIKVTRAVNGLFSLYVDGVLVPAVSGTNPGTDTTYVSGNGITTVSVSDGDKFALSCNTGACNYSRSIGVI